MSERLLERIDEWIEDFNYGQPSMDYEAESLLKDVRAYISDNSWKTFDSVPRDTDIHTYGYLLRYGNKEQRYKDIICYEENISANTVYPVKRTDYNNDGDTYVRTHWRLAIKPPNTRLKEGRNECN